MCVCPYVMMKIITNDSLNLLDSHLLHNFMDKTAYTLIIRELSNNNAVITPSFSSPNHQLSRRQSTIREPHFLIAEPLPHRVSHIYSRYIPASTARMGEPNRTTTL